MKKVKKPSNFIIGWDRALVYAYKWFRDYPHKKTYKEIVKDFGEHIKISDIEK